MNEKALATKEQAFRELLHQMNIGYDYPDYSNRDYWNNRYLDEKGQANEW